MAERTLGPETYFVIPAFNEGGAINDVISSIPSEYGIICVDDGSSDSTAAEVARTRALLVRHPINLGQGAALQTGFDFAVRRPSMKYVVTFDADGQHRIEDVAAMLDRIKETNVDVVMGSRFLGGAINMPFSKRMILKLAIKFSNLSTGVRLTDTHNGLRVLNRHAVESIHLRMPDFAHASEIVDQIRRHNLSCAEAPMTIVYSDYSRAKGQSLINAINIAFDVILNKVVGT